MKINQINAAQTFGKTPLLTCKIKDSETKKYNNATLYKMDPKNLSDIDEIIYSKNTNCIKNDFYNASSKRHQIKDFYVIKNDKTGEIMSCAQTEHRYRKNMYRKKESQTPGLYTLVEAMSENGKYINSSKPLLAYIVKKAQEQHDLNVYLPFHKDEISSQNIESISKDKFGSYFINNKDYYEVITEAEEDSEIEYLV